MASKAAFACSQTKTVPVVKERRTIDQDPHSCLAKADRGLDKITGMGQRGGSPLRVPGVQRGVRTDG